MTQFKRLQQTTAWCSEIGSLWSLDAPELHASVTSENQFHCTRLCNRIFKSMLVLLYFFLKKKRSNTKMRTKEEWTVCKIQRHLGLPGSAILKVVSLVSRLLDREALVHAHQYKSQ